MAVSRLHSCVAFSRLKWHLLHSWFLDIKTDHCPGVLIFCYLLLVCDVFSNLSRTWRNDAAPLFVHRACVFEGIREVKGQSHPNSPAERHKGYSQPLVTVLSRGLTLWFVCVCVCAFTVHSLTVVVFVLGRWVWNAFSPTEWVEPPAAPDWNGVL